MPARKGGWEVGDKEIFIKLKLFSLPPFLSLSSYHVCRSLCSIGGDSKGMCAVSLCYTDYGILLASSPACPSFSMDARVGHAKENTAGVAV